MTLALIHDGEFVAAIVEGASFEHEVMQGRKVERFFPDAANL
ncbi:hypothetical protein [Mesorhizobium sp. Mes31]|nr:hypothetical protein [Mesorhizobium sp. Mes31]